MVEFLKSVGCKDFDFEQGKRYVVMDDLTEDNLKNQIFVRQPNSPKNKNFWSKFPKSCVGDILKVLNDSELSWEERHEEERLLQL